MNRRAFGKAGAAASLAWTALSASRVHGANDRVRLGFIGVANRGLQLIESFLTHSDVEIGHRSTTFSHLANISLETRLRIEWDAQREKITNSEEANSLLHYEYRQPWTLGS
jgi:hypothetical protein